MTRGFSSRHLSVCIITAVISCGALTVTGPAAYADKHVARDKSGDVRAFPEGESSTVADPDNTDADIVKSWVKHSKRRVIVKVKLRDLTSLQSDEFIQLFAEIKSNKKRQAAVTFKSGGERAGFRLFRGRQELTCRGVKKKISPSKNTVMLSVPRTCLADPKWVRVGLATLAGEGNEFHHDEAFRSLSKFPAHLRLTPRLRRG